VINAISVLGLGALGADNVMELMSTPVGRAYTGDVCDARSRAPRRWAYTRVHSWRNAQQVCRGPSARARTLPPLALGVCVARTHVCVITSL